MAQTVSNEKLCTANIFAVPYSKCTPDILITAISNIGQNAVQWLDCI